MKIEKSKLSPPSNDDQMIQLGKEVAQVLEIFEGYNKTM
jgi:hypothetical protein